VKLLDPDLRPGAASRPAQPVAPTRGRRWTKLRIALVVVLVALTPVMWSYGRVLTRKSSDGLGVRSVEWVRDHGGSPLVAWIENEWYQHHAPPKGGLPKVLPSVAPAVTTAPPPPADVPEPVRLLVDAPLPAEGVWQPTGRTQNGGPPLLYTTFMRPDSVHTSLVTGLAWMDTKRVRFELWSGSQEPGGSGWHLQAPIPVGVRPDLVAAFNSGFKLADSRGGYYAEGRTARPLAAGKASMVFHADGSFDVGAWGTEVTMTPDVVGVRQNLQLLVDNGELAPNLDKASPAIWGWTVQNKTLVWRSGVGVDAHGHVLYAAGNGLSVASLANVLKAAGAVRAMELDINSAWTHFFWYHDDPTAGTAGTAGTVGTVGNKLLIDMTKSPGLYFESSSRDFVAVFVRRS